MCVENEVYKEKEDGEKGIYTHATKHNKNRKNQG
jgi:hypothetical protein